MNIKISKLLEKSKVKKILTIGIIKLSPNAKYPINIYKEHKKIEMIRSRALVHYPGYNFFGKLPVMI